MSSPDSAPAVIETKLRVPSPRPEQVLRPRLLGMLEEGLDCRVTLVSAPAGYGKTILLSQWLRSREADGVFAWVSLDEQDGDPIRLWRHIVESLGRGAQGDEFGAAILAALSVAGAEVSGTVLPTLVNVLGEVPPRVLLVLDDYQFAAGGGATRRWTSSSSTSRRTCTSSSRPAPTRAVLLSDRRDAGEGRRVALAAKLLPRELGPRQTPSGIPGRSWKGRQRTSTSGRPSRLSSGASRPCGIRTHKPTRIGLPASA
jgi:hypothetical protein